MSKKKLTRDLIKRLSKLIREGNYAVVAVKVVGISEGIFYSWMAQGRLDKQFEKKSLESELLESIEKAKALSEVDCVQYISKERDWKAKRWLLAQRHKERWSESGEVKHTGSVIITQETDLTNVSEEDLLRALQEKQETKEDS